MFAGDVNLCLIQLNNEYQTNGRGEGDLMPQRPEDQDPSVYSLNHIYIWV